MVEDRLREAQQRVVALLEEAGAAVATPIPDSEWTVADAAAHLVTGARLYSEFLGGAPSPITDMTETAAANQARMAEYEPRDVATLARDLRAAGDELAQAYFADDPDRMLAWHTGLKISARHTAQVLLGELLLHGWDMARALKKPWPIDKADAALVLDGAFRTAPTVVDPDKAKALDGVVEIRLRGSLRVAFTWRDGALSVGPPTGKPDCVVSADPVAMLLSSYGRGSKWTPVLTGKVVAYGRKPMLALKMLGAMRSP